MSDKAVDTFLFVFDSLPNRYMTQGMCDEAVNSYLLALNLLLIGLL